MSDWRNVSEVREGGVELLQEWPCSDALRPSLEEASWESELGPKDELRR